MTVRLVDLVATVALFGGLVMAAAVLASGYAARRLMHWVEDQLGNATNRGPFEIVYAMAGFHVRDLLLTLQRAGHSEPATVPMEAPVSRRWLRAVRFDPATLAPAARPPSPPVRTAVRLGPTARKPLDLSFPLVLSAMGWGVGVSDDVRQVLAEASALAGVAINGGEGPVLPVELEITTQWIWQWGRSSWQTEPTAPSPAMIELQVGQASEGGTAVRKPRTYLPRIMRHGKGIRGPLRIQAGLPRPLRSWVEAARRAGGGCPVAVKLPASQHLEADLARAVAAGVDVIVLDGAGAGTGGSAAVLTDNQGIPTAVAAVRAHRWLARAGRRLEISLIGPDTSMTPPMRPSSWPSAPTPWPSARSP